MALYFCTSCKDTPADVKCLHCDNELCESCYDNHTIEECENSLQDELEATVTFNG